MRIFHTMAVSHNILILLTLLTRTTHTFLSPTPTSKPILPRKFAQTKLNVKAESLTSDLSPEEQKIVDLFRNYGPSVAFITSTLGTPTTVQRRNRTPNKKNNNSNGAQRPLGSGSGFLLTEDGYLLTNYHVIERAYGVNTTRDATTKRIPPPLSAVLSGVVNATTPLAKVLVRLNSVTKYRDARIVAVRPEYDVAILKISTDDDRGLLPIPPGVSSNLLVGQRLVAIGNPFGLDQTVTSGVVSALNREITTYSNLKITGCIQTDAAINPGNSGGPLLDSTGRWIGVNTAIISTTGSNAGIGFAVPVDRVKDYIEEVVDDDRVRCGEGGRRGRGYLGVDALNDDVGKALCIGGGVGIASVGKLSPAEEAGLRCLRVGADGVVVGDKIVAVNGNVVDECDKLKEDFLARKEGEKISLTVQALDGNKEKRVLYITLKRKNGKKTN